MDGLKYSIKKQPKCVFDIDIEVAWEETNRELENIYNKIKTKVKISGFRKGKVPLDMIKSGYSEEAREDLVDKFSPKILDEIFEKEKIKRRIRDSGWDKSKIEETLKNTYKKSLTVTFKITYDDGETEVKEIHSRALSKKEALTRAYIRLGQISEYRIEKSEIIKIDYRD